MLPECFALSAPRRHVDLDVGWMLSEPLPHPPLLFALIKASGVKEVTEHKVKSELIMSVNVEGFSIRGRDGWGGGVQSRYAWAKERERRGRGHSGGWEKRGKKTLLPQHDLQIALSPWRLLSALSSIQSGSPNSGATVWYWVGGGVDEGLGGLKGCWQKSHHLNCLWVRRICSLGGFNLMLSHQ